MSGDEVVVDLNVEDVAGDWLGGLDVEEAGEVLGVLDVKEVGGGFTTSDVEECGDAVLDVLVVGVAMVAVEAAVYQLALVPL